MNRATIHHVENKSLHGFPLIYFIQNMEIFLGFLLRDYVFITTIIFFVFFGMATEWKERVQWLTWRCDSPQASMKLSPPHRSPALPRRGPPHRYCCSPPYHRHSPVRAAGTTGTAGTGDSPAQGGW